MKSIDKAVKQALKELEDWHAPVNPPSRLVQIIKNAVEYGYQACTMDIDRRKKEKEKEQ
jgi:hypothetical protein